MTHHPGTGTADIGGRTYTYYPLETAGVADLDRLPYTVKILLENMLRGAATQPDLVSADDVRALATWDPGSPGEAELPFMPARVILQDFTGVPCVVDLAAMRDAIADLGGDPSRINPLVPADLVIDHSVQVDQFGSDAAFLINVEREYERNGERYALLRWAQQAFRDFRVVPPGTGIVHQVNLEFLADVVTERNGVLLPDTLVGTDSHTTMINGLGVVGWGVGGIEAEAALLGQPLYQPMPIVVGFRLDGEMPPGATATDLVLYVTEMLRAHGVVGKFVEFFGPGTVEAVAGRPGHHQQHVARVRRDRHDVPDRRRDIALPAHDRPARRGDRASRGLRPGTGPVQDRCVTGASLQRVPQPRPRHHHALAGRPEAAAGSGRALGPSRVVPGRFPRRRRGRSRSRRWVSSRGPARSPSRPPTPRRTALMRTPVSRHPRVRRLLPASHLPRGPWRSTWTGRPSSCATDRWSSQPSRAAPTPATRRS